VVRSAVYVDPTTGQATAKADPLPQITEGIPITYRTIRVDLDRPGFSLNPTSCAQKETTATVTSTLVAVATPSSPFRAANCAKLPFKPALSFQLLGGTHRGAHPKLKATLRMPEGGANIAATQVALPHSEFIENAHFKTICTRVQFAAHECPAGSIYGEAEAKTPLLEQPLKGPVYLRSSDNELPDVVAGLRGQVEIALDGRIDSVKGRMRTTFDVVPDVPVSKFMLTVRGGKNGLLVNSTDLCARKYKVIAKFTGQNGKHANQRPKLRAPCKKQRR